MSQEVKVAERGADADFDTAKLEVQAAMYKAQFVQAVEALESNLEQLFRHLENMAAHVVALEAVLTEVVKDHKIDMAAVQAAIRKKIADGTEGKGDPDKALGVAAEITGARP